MECCWWRSWLRVTQSVYSNQKTLCTLPITVTLHSSLNSSRGVIRLQDFEGVGDDKIGEELSTQGVMAVRRISFHWNNELVLTNTLVLTFSCPALPKSIKAKSVEPYNASSVKSLAMVEAYAKIKCHVLIVVNLNKTAKSICETPLIAIVREPTLHTQDSAQCENSRRRFKRWG